MQTISHGLWSYVIAHRSRHAWAFVLGAVFPDLVYALAFVYLLLRQGLRPHTTLASTQLSFPYWGGAVLHSVAIWLAALVTARLLSSRPWITWFAGGWGLHLVVDLLTHREMASPYFFPFYNRPIKGIVSFNDPAFIYWDRALLALAGLILVTGWLVRRAGRH